MRIGILTFHFAINFGAALQAYALKRYLISQGHDVAILNYVPAYHKGADSDFKTPAQIISEKQSAGSGFVGTVLSLGKNTLTNVYAFRKRRQRICFKAFQEANLVDTLEVESFDELLNLEKSYDAIVVGSDQIWNPALTGGSFDPAYFGYGLKNSDTKVVAYAASAGSLIGEKNRDSFIALMRGIDKVSSREKSLCNEILKWAPESKCITVLDPTMLLETSDWLALADESGRFDDCESYILVYQLIPDNRIMRLARFLAKRDGIRIITIGHKVVPGSSSLCDLSPDDFVSCFRNAKYVVTNSFHGTVFSIIFEREFFVVYPSERASRISDLLKLLHLDDRAVVDGRGIARCLDSMIDYEEVFAALERERSKSRLYLRDAF